jgi:hypothetical protein
MAVLAGEPNVRSSQRELGGVVIEFSAWPLDGGVADRTVGRESRGYVVRIRCCLKLGKVTARTGGRSSCIFSTHMT